MCVTKPTTEASLGEKSEVCGLPCPVCEGASKVNYMRFLDPHGVERVDRDIFECTTKRHTFTRAAGGLRLLAADGERAKDRQLFKANGSLLVPQSA